MSIGRRNQRPLYLDIKPENGLVARWTFDDISDGVIPDVIGGQDGTYDADYAEINQPGVMTDSLKTIDDGDPYNYTTSLTTAATLPVSNAMWSGDFTFSYWRRSVFDAETFFQDKSLDLSAFRNLPALSGSWILDGYRLGNAANSDEHHSRVSVGSAVWMGGFDSANRGLGMHVAYGGWFHFCIRGTYDASKNQTTIELFINGVQQGNNTYPYPKEVGATNPFTGKVTGSTVKLYGDVPSSFDDVRVYNRALNVKEIQALAIDMPGVDDQYANEVKRDMAVAFYRMRPTEGGSEIKDEGGRGEQFNVPIGGDPEIITDGGPFGALEQNNNALLLSSDNDGYLDISSVDDYLRKPPGYSDNWRGITINMWVRVDPEDTGRQTLLGGFSGNETKSKEAEFYFENGKLNLFPFSISADIALDHAWTMYTVTLSPNFKGSNQNTQAVIYKDGIKLGQGSYGSSISQFTQVGFTKVGQNKAGTNNLDGLVADVSIHHVGMSEEMVAALFYKGVQYFDEDSA